MLWLKQHLIGGFRNATKCPFSPDYVREELKNFMLKKAEEKAAQMIPNIPEEDDYDEEEIDGGSKKKAEPQMRKQRGPLDRFVTLTPSDILQGRKDRKGIFGVKGIFGICDKELRSKVCGGIARWLCDAVFRLMLSTMIVFTR